MINIEGKNIRLRDMGLDDLSDYHHWQQPGHEWSDFDGPYYTKLTSEEVDKAVESLEKQIVAKDLPEKRSRLIIADKQTDEMLGIVSRYWISKETHWSAVGIVIFDSAFWGKGIGYEALGLWSDYLFRQFPDWVRLDLRTWSGNHGMIYLSKKLGYQEEARFRNARIVKGAYFDGLGYGVLRDEWEACFPAGFVASL